MENIAKVFHTTVRIKHVGFCQEATPYAVLQPPKRQWPYPRHSVRRSGAWSQRLPQKQVNGKVAGVRRRPS